MPHTTARKPARHPLARLPAVAPDGELRRRRATMPRRDIAQQIAFVAARRIAAATRRVACTRQARSMPPSAATLLPRAVDAAPRVRALPHQFVHRIQHQAKAGRIA